MSGIAGDDVLLDLCKSPTGQEPDRRLGRLWASLWDRSAYFASELGSKMGTLFEGILPSGCSCAYSCWLELDFHGLVSQREPQMYPFDNFLLHMNCRSCHPSE